MKAWNCFSEECKQLEQKCARLINGVKLRTLLRDVSRGRSEQALDTEQGRKNECAWKKSSEVRKAS